MNKTIPILLNVFLFPMGYFYLRQTLRLILGAAWVILAPTILRFLLGRVAPESTYGWPQIAFLAVVFFAFLIFVIFDTIRVTKSERPEAAGIFSKPAAYFVGPLLFFLILATGALIRPLGEMFIRFNSVPSMSMTPNLISTDYVYWKPLGESHELKRGDIVIYASPDNPEKLLMSRVIGIPGDMLEIDQQDKGDLKIAAISINGHAGEYRIENEKPNMAYLDIVAPPESRLITEVLQTGESHMILEYPDNFPFLPYDSASLHEGEYFLLSDNRDDSKDSRFIGAVSRKAIKGRPMYVVFSLNNGNALCNQQSDPSLPFEHCVPKESAQGYIRWDRIGIVPK